MTKKDVRVALKGEMKDVEMKQVSGNGTDRVVAVAGMNRDRDMAALEELKMLGRMPPPARLRYGTTNYLTLRPGVKAQLNCRPQMSGINTRDCQVLIR